MSANTAVSIRATRRFSEGMELIPVTASMLRVGRFSDGLVATVTMTPARQGSFADGLVDRPDASAPRRIGSFGDTQTPVGRPRAARLRGRRPTPARA
jgi:hypothetical protein